MDPTDICNMALIRVGYPTPIGNLYEGSPAARVAVQAYSQTRDLLLRMRDWGFTRQTVSLGAPLKTAPVGGYAATPWTTAYPPIDWIYEYPYPDNCIEVRALLPNPTIPNQMPRYVAFEKASNSDLNRTVILTNLANAFASITALVDDPAQWTDAGFTEALITALTAIFARAFPTKDANVNAEVLADTRMGQAGAAANARQG